MGIRGYKFIDATTFRSSMGSDPKPWYKGEVRMLTNHMPASLCNNGFHFSEKPIDAYNNISTEVVLYVESQGDFVKDEFKFAARGLKVLEFTWVGDIVKEHAAKVSAIHDVLFLIPAQQQQGILKKALLRQSERFNSAIINRVKYPVLANQQSIYTHTLKLIERVIVEQAKTVPPDTEEKPKNLTEDGILLKESVGNWRESGNGYFCEVGHYNSSTVDCAREKMCLSTHPGEAVHKESKYKRADWRANDRGEYRHGFLCDRHYRIMILKEANKPVEKATEVVTKPTLRTIIGWTTVGSGFVCEHAGCVPGPTTGEREHTGKTVATWKFRDWATAPNRNRFLCDGHYKEVVLDPIEASKKIADASAPVKTTAPLTSLEKKRLRDKRYRDRKKAGLVGRTNI